MSEIHDLVLLHGREAARELVSSKHEKLCVDIAAEILAEESNRLGITHSGFCLTSLPHRKIEDLSWKREGYKLSLIVQSGLDRDQQPIGIPYGAAARMILLYLQTRAIQTDSRQVELGGSLHEWMNSMGVSSVGGNTYKRIREQARRISSCHLTFFWDGEGVEGRHNGAFVENEISLTAGHQAQAELWQDTVELNSTFFKALKEHPVPLWEPAIRQISGKSMALDIYIWLAYRLQSLERPTPLTWLSVFSQFGSGFKALKHFKPEFRRNLELALAVYPEAKVEEDKKGIVLHPSRPPIEARRFMAIEGGL